MNEELKCEAMSQREDSVAQREGFWQCFRALTREELIRETKKSHKPELWCRLKQTQATPATPATATMLAITATTTTGRKSLLDTGEDRTQTGVCPRPPAPGLCPG